MHVYLTHSYHSFGGLYGVYIVRGGRSLPVFRTPLEGIYHRYIVNRNLQTQSLLNSDINDIA
jgi:hypothetical protein